MTEQHPDPGGEATARVAQLAAMTVSVGEALARLRAQRAHSRADTDLLEERALRASAASDAARARLVYRQAMSPSWIRTADTAQLLTTWRSAGPYVGDDPMARLATGRVEKRLRLLHPEAMTVFDGLDQTGMPRDHRMHQAAGQFRGPYGLDPVGTPIDQVAQAAPQPTPLDAAQAAFPVSTRDAMPTAPAAAKRAVLAITAGPARKQLTAAPHQPVRSTR